MYVYIFFFKRKTAYEMRISDWSSDVCSSDLAWLVAGLNPFGERSRVDAYAEAGIEALAMEFMPRITRAQSMDILSSQSKLAGYKAVLDAAAAYDRVFPMMMTAAGTVSSARVFVLGVGVAGLRGIAPARSEEHSSDLQPLKP